MTAGQLLEALEEDVDGKNREWIFAQLANFLKRIGVEFRTFAVLAREPSKVSRSLEYRAGRLFWDGKLVA